MLSSCGCTGKRGFWGYADPCSFAWVYLAADYRAIEWLTESSSRIWTKASSSSFVMCMPKHTLFQKHQLNEVPRTHLDKRVPRNVLWPGFQKNKGTESTREGHLLSTKSQLEQWCHTGFKPLVPFLDDSTKWSTQAVWAACRHYLLDSCSCVCMVVHIWLQSWMFVV